MTLVTVVTGFLGSGKTTIIFNLIKHFPKEYKVVLLKNEFGDVKVDSELAKESNIQVTEMLNGCLCCVLVGQMKNALLEIQKSQNPDRILIETSGSAFPAPIAWQIRELQDQDFKLDAIITVIDCINFKGYKDTSYTAKLQAQYTDLIILNKHELVSERDLDLAIDYVNDLNTDTPKVKYDVTNGISPDLIFGLDTRLFELVNQEADSLSFHMNQKHQESEVDLINIQSLDLNDAMPFGYMTSFLESFKSEDVYRIKGLIPMDDGRVYILNWAFNRYTLTPCTQTLQETRVKLTIMGIDLKTSMNVFQNVFPKQRISLVER